MPPQETLSEFQLSEVEQKAHEILVPKRERIDPDSFADLYEKEKIEADKQRVLQMEKGFSGRYSKQEKEFKKLSEVFESLFSELVELEDWFGEDVFMVETSKFDDYVNGVDLVAEFLRDGLFTHLGLAIDITTISQVKEKIKKILNEIRAGQLPRIKYFVSEGGDFRGELSNIPRVVIGTDRRSLDKLAQLWLDFMRLRSQKQKSLQAQDLGSLNKKISETKKALRTHPVQIELLAQIELQLEAFGKYSEKIGKTELAQKYKSILSIIHKIRSDKGEIEQRTKTQVRDMKMYKNIEQALRVSLPFLFNI